MTTTPTATTAAVPLPTSWAEVYIDARTQGYQGPLRNAKHSRAAPSGGGAIAKSDDGSKCAVTGKECKLSPPHYSSRLLKVRVEGGAAVRFRHLAALLTVVISLALRIVRVWESDGSHRIEVSRNLWEGSGLKIDCASTDVAWGCKREFTRFSKLLSMRESPEHEENRI